MKKFNEKHEVIIDCYFTPTVKAKEGEVSPHFTRVQGISFYQRHYNGDMESFVKVQITKDMILDLASEIAEIEKNVVNMKFTSLPWSW